MSWIGCAWVWTTGHATILATMVSALAAVAIAGFTLSLKRSTDKLWKATKEQARLTREGIELGNKEFVSTHRPRLHVRLFRAHNFDVNRPLVLQYEIVNIGATESYIVEHTVGVQAFAQGGGGPRLDGANISIEGSTIAAGATRLVSWTAKNIIYEGNWGASFSIDFSGKITYRDDNGAIRRTSFLRRFKSTTNRFEAVSDPDYEYED